MSKGNPLVTVRFPKELIEKLAREADRFYLSKDVPHLRTISGIIRHAVTQYFGTGLPRHYASEKKERKKVKK